MLFILVSRTARIALRCRWAALPASAAVGGLFPPTAALRVGRRGEAVPTGG